jgi:hypothetical protein
MEKSTIINILRNNEYNTKLFNKVLRQKKRNTQGDLLNQNTKRVTFTHSGKEVREVTKIFRDTRTKVAFQTRNTIQDTSRPWPQINKYRRSGIYQMKCLDCPLQSIGRMGRIFNTRYKKHIHNIRGISNNAGNSNHIIQDTHMEE